MMVSELSEVEQIMYSDLEPFFIALVKELGRHAKEKHLSYRHALWGDNPAQRVILDILQDKPLDELWTNTDEALDRGAFLGWFWLHMKGLMPKYEMDPTQRAWYNLATREMR